ncbi:MAG: hypothetical protein OXN17_21940 [Candidatus Poribacteria bacterium]|nr:hypothetical protein [Candidatus Poribacteria bacterium]MDE0505900.1 hypothetical protein [Candidatus Poribacteria bacterium]
MTLASVLLSLSPSFVGSVAAHTDTLLAGAAENLFTPAMEQSDDWQPTVYEDLYARSLVLSDGRNYLAIITADHFMQGFDESEMMRRVVNRATGIPPNDIFINFSHTHNSMLPGERWRKEAQVSTAELDIPYDEWLGREGRELDPFVQWWFCHLAEATKRAKDNLRPAELGVGRAPVQIGYNRRSIRDGVCVMAENPNGAVVPWTDVLGVYSKDTGRCDAKNRIAVMFTHAAHPVIVHFGGWPNPDYSKPAIGPDFPGYAVKHLRNLLTADDQQSGVLMFAQACGANINGFPLRGGIGACEVAGLSLAFATRNAIDNRAVITPGVLRNRQSTLSLPYKLPPVEQVKKWLSEDPESGNLKHLLEVSESGVRKYLELPMTAYAIGNDLVILMLPGEMFCEYQLHADAVSSFPHTIVLGYINGSVSYVATAKDYELPDLTGGHGVSPNSAYLPLEPETEGMIKDGIAKLLNDLKADCG